MKIILLKNIQNLGQEGEVKEVTEGYFRNFLFPQKLALATTPSLIKQAQQKLEMKQKKIEAEQKTFQELVKKLSAAELILAAQTDEKGTLYGAVQARDLAKKLKETGFDISEEKIKFEQPIKTIGEHEIKVKLGHGMEAMIKIKVEPRK